MSDDEGDPLARNRLDEEASPYLRQHADNPVNWQPWDETALAAARERDRPIFLSVGYSSCHWCHVMAEESFEDPGIADLLNEGFVPVKVDREEHPDVDAVYIQVCQLVRGRAGWPLSAFLTPDLKPFFVGTYFPPEPRRGQPGFRGIVEDAADGWQTEREETVERAEQWAAAAAGEFELPDPEEPDPGVVGEAAAAAVERADREDGGWGPGQKFPHPRRIDLLLRAAERDAGGEHRAVARETLDAMARGGLRDHVGGGFHRYCVDRDWTVPHFEKMLYDNAEIPRAFLAGYRALGDRRYADVARESLEFLDREFRDDGGFYAAFDARSVPPGGDEPEEGAYYTWTPAEVESALDPELAALVETRYGVTKAGNFEGRTVPTVSASVEEVAAEHDADTDAVSDRLETARRRLRDARSERPAPERDEKVLAGWNGLAVSAFADGALALDPSYAGPAAEALGAVRDELWDGDGHLARRYADGDVAGDGYLDDYAFLARGALDLYGATGDAGHLAFAADLGRAAVDRFADEGVLRFTPPDSELIARPTEADDGSIPSAVGVAAETLLRLDEFVDASFEAAAAATVDAYGARVNEEPLRHVSLAVAADALDRGPLEVVPVADGWPPEWREKLGTAYLPDALFAPRPPDIGDWLDALGRTDAPAVWASRDDRGIYVCRRTCSPPCDTAEEALEWAAEFS
jgi:uncharacterized protein YyaL (SSP411 family)